MALIGTIRKNSWLLVVMIVLGVGGFVFMDISSVGGPGGGQQFSIGEVDGKPIDWADFQMAEQALYQGQSIDVYNRRDYLWNYFIQDAIVRSEAKAIGLNVGDEEMQELQFGTNLSPVVQRNFSNPQTQQIDRESLNQFRQAANDGTLAPQYKRIWDFQQIEIVKDRLQKKLQTMVLKGIYTPTWLAESYQNDVTGTVDFRYVQIPFDQVDDSEIEVSDADYTAYVKENASLYTRDEEMRDAVYVAFDVLPTKEDSLALYEAVQNLIQPFTETDDDSLFAENNFGSYSEAFFKSAEISPAIADTVFDLPIGTVYGPYIDAGAYQAVKILDRRTIPDSVSSRHILISVQTQEQVPGALAQADSIMNLLQTGAEPFDSLAMKLSGDAISGAQGGDLGYVALGTFVQPMNDHIFYSDAQIGEVERVVSQFGIHLVEITGRKFETNEVGVRMAFVVEPIIPSETTQDYAYDDVLELAGQNRTVEALRATIDADEAMTLEEANNLSRNAFDFGELGRGNTSREIVRWLFDAEAEVGEVAPTVFTYEDDVNYFNSKYVVVGLSRLHKPGLAKAESIMDLIEAPVKNKKKGEVLKGRITGQDLASIAGQFSVEVDSVEKAHFGLQFLRNIGSEPLVLGKAMGMNIGDVSEPIIGENGVYVIQIIQKEPPAVATNMAEIRRQAASSIKQAAEFELMSAMKDKAKIKDNRFTYY